MNDQKRKALIEQWISPHVRALSSYAVPDSSGLLKLDAMENPYVWDDALQQAWLKQLESAHVNRYPDPDAKALKRQIKKVMQVPERLDLLFGNGSDELILLLALAVAAPGRSVLTFEPGFVMFRQIALMTQLQFEAVSLTPDFELDLAATLAQIKSSQPALIFIAQPNNPTGNLFGDSNIRKIIEAAPGLVVIDEAYTAFTDSDFMPLLDDYENLLIMRTLSKTGLAGLRLGFLIGDKHWLSELNKIRLPYNVGVLNQISAEFALQHYPVFEAQTASIRKARTSVLVELKNIEGLHVWPSEANFILVRTKAGQARLVFERLREHGVLIKCLDGAHPLLKDCLRVTIGTQEENRQFIGTLKQCL